MVDIATLTDNFDDNSKDGTKWGTNGNPFGVGTTGVTVAETGAQLQVTPAASQSTEFTSGYISANFYDLTASAAYVRIANAPQANGLYVYFRLSSGGGAGLGFDIENGTVYVRDNSNTFTTFAYNSTTHAWFRIRESGGTVFWDTASSSASNPPSSGDWTNRHSTSGYSTDHTAVKVYLGAGTYLSIGSPGTAQFDGFNTATSGGGGAAFANPFALLGVGRAA